MFNIYTVLFPICVVFRDINTPRPFVEEFPTFEPMEGVEYATAALPDHIYMDAMAFGMGCCCLQMTFQACNICEARHLYDQLTPMCPIMVRAHTHTHTFNGPFSGTTQVSWYQKGKTNLDFTVARDSEWQWHQLSHMEVAPCSREITMPAPNHAVFYRLDALHVAQPTASKHKHNKYTAHKQMYAKSKRNTCQWTQVLDQSEDPSTDTDLHNIQHSLLNC